MRLCNQQYISNWWFQPPYKKKNRNIFVSCLHKAGGSALAAHSHRDCRRQRNDTHVGVS
jgi:hypothetical protein